MKWPEKASGKSDIAIKQAEQPTVVLVTRCPYLGVEPFLEPMTRYYLDRLENSLLIEWRMATSVQVVVRSLNKFNLQHSSKSTSQASTNLHKSAELSPYSSINNRQMYS